MLIVGFDCATDYRKVGLACASHDGRLAIHEARVARSPDDVVATIVDWLSQGPDAVLAIDAPLGWPLPLAQALATLRAGDELPTDSHSLFRRHTDRELRRRLGQQSLDVGADRVARTAHAALQVLASVRAKLRVEMGWSPGRVTGRQVIEVYPAATLRALHLEPRGYKGRASHSTRTTLLDSLGLSNLALGVRSNAGSSDHVFDAIVCAVAAADYVTGNVVSPSHPELAEREGWIWARA